MPSWSQKYFHIEFDYTQPLTREKTVSVKVMADTTIKEAFYNKICSLSIERDTLTIYDTIRTNIINRACNLIGVRYCYGKSSETGFDCSGYVKYVFADFGLELPHSSYGQYKMSNHLKAPDAKPGDLVFFITRGSNISHVGIYLGGDQFIHSPGYGGVVSIDSLKEGYYKNHLVGFGSIL